MTYSELISRPGVLLVEFYATWCPHCQRMMPVVDQLRTKIGDRAEIIQLDIDKHSEAADEAGAQSVPTFIIYKDGKEQFRHVGEISGDLLLSHLESVIG